MAEEDESMASGSEEEQETAVESLIAGREKRSTAANRYSTLLQQEGGGGDDDLELLFAEDGVEEDAEFAGEDGEGASDVDMDSSSDDDQGPTAGGEDMEGEKELEKQERAERKKKRKADMTFTKLKPRAPRGVKVDPSAGPMVPTPRPKKKSERVSWLPTPDDGPVRSSSRRQTVQNKAVVIKRMKESEVKRRQQLKIMEAAQKRKEAEKQPELTQADRMAEAARVERQNAKSLNRWEAEEKRRQEERQAKLDALKNRKLEGPVITYWSGKCIWYGDKLISVGSGNRVVEIKDSAKPKPGPKPKVKSADVNRPESEHPQSSGERDIIMIDAPTQAPPGIHPPMVVEDIVPSEAPAAEVPEPAAPNVSAPSADNVPERQVSQSDVAIQDGDTAGDIPHHTTEEQNIDASFPNAESGAPATRSPEHIQSSNAISSPKDLQPQPQLLAQSQVPVTSQILPESQTMSQPSAPLLAPLVSSAGIPDRPLESTQELAHPLHSAPPGTHIQAGLQSIQPHPFTQFPVYSPAPPPPPPPPPTRETAARTLMILENFDSPLAIKNHELREHILLKGRKAIKLTAKQQKANQELCAITGQIARFRDPRTGLAYKGPDQYGQIRKLETQVCRWSTLLGTWVGDRTRAAKGVPEGFTGAGRKQDENKTTSST